MSGIQMNSLRGRAAAAGGLGALLFTVGCGGALNGGGVQRAAARRRPAGHTGGRQLRTEPADARAADDGQRRRDVAGRVRVDRSAGRYAQQPMAQPYAAPVSYRAARASRSGDRGRSRDPRVLSGETARPVRTNQVVYGDDRRAPVKRSRSVKKSAVIIGSSAGVGAAVGAAVKGKKGALIGAAIGGGGAAVWDQITRRKQ